MSQHDQDEAEEILRVLGGLVPDVGDTFTHTVTFLNAPGYSETSHYRVTGWLRRRAPRKPDPDPRVEAMLQNLDEKYPREGHGPDNVPLEFCRRSRPSMSVALGWPGSLPAWRT